MNLLNRLHLHTQNLISFNPKALKFRISPSDLSKFTNFAITAERRELYRFSPAMESHNSPTEDFVHIHNPFEVLDQQKNEDLYANQLTEDDLSANRLTVEDVFANQEKNEDLLTNPIIGESKEDEGVDEPKHMDLSANHVISEDLSANKEKNEDLPANQIIGEGLCAIGEEGEGVDEGLSANHVIGEDLFANGEFGEMYERKILPEELSKTVMVLSCESSAEGGSCDVYLVGTAHVSQESCKEVQAVISFLKPQVVFLELCSRRVDVLTPQNLKVPSMREMIEMWKAKQNAFGVLYSWFLAKVSTKLEVFPGSEFRVAYEEAKKYGGKVVLGDRPVQITLGRTWAKMPLWHKTKLVYSLFFQALFLPSSEDLNKMLKEMDDSDMLTLVIQEMSKEFPTLMETLVHERDQYLSSTLLRVAREHGSVVAVVGKGHLRGIKKHWQQPIEIQDLMQMPAQKTGVSPLRVIASLGVAAVGVAIISGIYISSKK